MREYEEALAAGAHRLELEGRERLTVSGVEDVERFDETGIVLTTTAGVLSKTATMSPAMNCTSTPTASPKARQMPTAYRSVCAARSCLPAPTFCAASADTVDSMEDGTRNTKLMTFSTMPTAAASFRPRWLAMMVMRMKDTCIKPSCSVTGTPTRKMGPITSRRGRKLSLRSGSPVFCRRMTASAAATLSVCVRVVPSAAPAGPIPSQPIKR